MNLPVYNFPPPAYPCDVQYLLSCRERYIKQALNPANTEVQRNYWARLAANVNAKRYPVLATIGA
jgi:hypothetical protein